MIAFLVHRDTVQRLALATGALRPIARVPERIAAAELFGDRLYLQTSSGSDATLQERVICFNADTGKLLWEHRYNLFTSDVPPHRIAWSSPAVDTATGNVFAISGNGLLMSLSP